ncbi:MAG: FN3 associated domain-containing protein [Ginsengibacter sp.]
MENHLKFLDKAGINYSRSFYDAIIIPSNDADGSLQLRFDTEIEGLEIYYTFDNTFPDQFSSLYKKTDGIINIPKDAETLRVITYRNGKTAGKMITVPLADLEKRIEKK